MLVKDRSVTMRSSIGDIEESVSSLGAFGMFCPSFSAHLMEVCGCALEDQPEHDMLVFCCIHIVSQLVCRLPQFLFYVLYIHLNLYPLLLFYPDGGVLVIVTMVKWELIQGGVCVFIGLVLLNL